MTTFMHCTACAPYALARLFGKTYDEVCREIRQAGGHYQGPSWDALAKMLEPYGIKRHEHLQRTRDFNLWRRNKPGYWVVVVESTRAPSAHCVTLKDGQMLDNGWVSYASAEQTLRVRGAWQIEQLRVA